MKEKRIKENRSQTANTQIQYFPAGLEKIVFHLALSRKLQDFYLNFILIPNGDRIVKQPYYIILNLIDDINS